MQFFSKIIYIDLGFPQPSLIPLSFVPPVIFPPSGPPNNQLAGSSEQSLPEAAQIFNPSSSNPPAIQMV